MNLWLNWYKLDCESQRKSIDKMGAFHLVKVLVAILLCDQIKGREPLKELFRRREEFDIVYLPIKKTIPSEVSCFLLRWMIIAFQLKALWIGSIQTSKLSTLIILNFKAHTIFTKNWWGDRNISSWIFVWS